MRRFLLLLLLAAAAAALAYLALSWTDPWFSGERPAAQASLPAGSSSTAGAAARAAPATAPHTSEKSVVRAPPVYGAQGTVRTTLPLSVRVLRASPSLEPAPGATVLLDDHPVGVSEADGLLRVEVPVAEGDDERHMLWAEAGEARSAVAVVHTTALPEDTVDLVLVSPAVLTGRVLDLHGVPVPGASIALDPPAEGPVTSDEEGRFTWTDLPPGRYHVEAWKRDAAATMDLALRAGERRSAVLRLVRLGGPFGQVVDEHRAPVAGALVELVADEDAPSTIARRTDAQGRFRFPATLVERVRITAHDEDTTASVWAYAPWTPLTLVLHPTGIVTGQVRTARGDPARGASVRTQPPLAQTPAVTATASGQGAHYRLEHVPTDTTSLWVAATGESTYQRYGGLEVRAGEETRFDILLRERAGETVTGTVQDADTSQGIEGAEVQVYPIKDGRTYAELRSFARTDRDGHFRIEHVVADGLMIEASHPGYLPARKIQSSLTPVVLSLRPGHRVRGRVVDESYVPISHFSIGGRYVDDPLGRFDLTLEAADETVTIGAPGFTERHLPLPNADPADLGTVVLKRTEPLLVRVVDAAGRPVPGAEVYAFDENLQSMQAARQSAWPRILGRTDEEGSARVVRPGDTECIGALAAGKGPSGEVPCPKATGDTDEVRLRLLAPATLEGTLGAPGISVRVTEEDVGAVTGAAGHFRIEGLGPGPHRVFLAGPLPSGVRQTERVVDLVPGQTTTLDLSSDERGAIALTLRGPPSDRVTLNVWPVSESAGPPAAPAARTFLLQTFEGEDTVTLDDVPAGRVRVEATTPTQSGRTEVEVSAGETTPATLTLHATK